MFEQISRTKLVPPDFGDKPVEETFHYTNEIYYGASEAVQNIFEFMANATEVEWAVFRFGSEDNIFPHSVLVTSHADQNKEVTDNERKVKKQKRTKKRCK